MSYRRITVTMTTTGSVTPGFEEVRKDYTWNGDPDKSEAVRTAGRPRQVPESLRGGPNARREERERRYKRFCELREKGIGKIAAGAEVGIERRAAARYEKQRLEEEEQRGETADA